MTDYKYRAKCSHRGAIWNPPNKEVATVPCTYCKATPGEACRGRSGVVPPHSARYMTHHEANCGKGPDWTALR